MAQHRRRRDGTLRAKINTTGLGYDDSRSFDGDYASFAFLQVLSGFLQKICIAASDPAQ